MLRERLTPPPVETYSLNRKLSGSFLLCARLGSRVDAMAIWREATRGYEFGPE
jgi:aarF domain-containing kinase